MYIVEPHLFDVVCGLLKVIWLPLIPILVTKFVALITYYELCQVDLLDIKLQENMLLLSKSCFVRNLRVPC